MSIDPSIKLVRTLKGAPLSILLILKMIGQPATAEYLERTSGYSDKPVNAALQLLEEYGLISRNGRYAWQICDNARQLPLMNLLDVPKIEPDSQEEVTLLSEADKSDSNSGTRNNSESELFRVPSSSSTLNLDSKELEVKGLQLLEPADDSEKFRVSENLAACDAAEIHEPKRSKLSKLPHVTAALIRYHTQTAATIPLAIYRIEKGWRIKDGWIDTIPVSVIACYSECSRANVQSAEPELPDEAAQVWEQARAALAKKLRTVDYQTWVVPLKLVSFDDRGYQVRACNQRGGEWVVQHALALLQNELQAEIRIEWNGKDGE